VALFGVYWVFLHVCFSKIRQKRLKSLNIRNACGERLEQRSLHPPPARDLPLGVWAYNRYLAWSWAFQGCTRGEPYSENTAEKYCRNAFGNLNKETTLNQKEKMLKNCALDVPEFAPLIDLYLKSSGDVVGSCKKYCIFENHRAFCSGLKTGSSYRREACSLEGAQHEIWCCFLKLGPAPFLEVELRAEYQFFVGFSRAQSSHP
jgi:hypothetical protein